MSSTNVHGRNYGTHIQGANGRTLCRRYAQADVNCQSLDPDQEAQASCKLCQRARVKRAAQGKEQRPWASKISCACGVSGKPSLP